LINTITYTSITNRGYTATALASHPLLASTSQPNPPDSRTARTQRRAQATIRIGF
jgi:hypothetical protein